MRRKLLLMFSVLLMLNSCQEIELFEGSLDAMDKTSKEKSINELLSTSNLYEVVLPDKNIIARYKSTKSSISDTLNQTMILNEYIKFIDNQWQMNISLEEANKLGVSSEIYNIFAKSMIDVNESIVETILANENRRLNRAENTPMIKRYSESGGGPTGGGPTGGGPTGGGTTGGGTYPPFPTVDASGVPIPNPAINVYKDAELNYASEMTSFAGPYKIKAIVGVVAFIGFWKYDIYDDVFSTNIHVTGSSYGQISSNRTHDLKYPLVPQNGICSWHMHGRKEGADNTKISVTYKSNL